MNEVFEFFHNLLRPDSWPARWNCGNWTGFHGWLYIVSSLAIGVAYFSIPAILFSLIKKSVNKLPFQKIFWLFILFILGCGFTHIFDALMFWYPVYRASAVVLFITAIFSIATAIALYKIIPSALALKSPVMLEQIILQRTNELAKSNEYLIKINEQLERSQNESQLVIKQKDEFLNIASHELKTPLTALKAITHFLQEQSPKTRSEDEIFMLSKMDGQIIKLTILINGLLDTSNLQGKQFAYRKEVFNLSELIISVAGAMQKATEHQEIIIEENESVSIYADKERIAQALNNLLANAVKYSTSTNKIIISTKAGSNEVTCVVKDFGIGIPGEQLNKIFDKFYRVSGENMHTYPGMGLGLYISRDIIKRHGGKIWVESTEGKGATFYFSLPIYRPGQ